jgi:hypothetical protein
MRPLASDIHLPPVASGTRSQIPRRRRPGYMTSLGPSTTKAFTLALQRVDSPAGAKIQAEHCRSIDERAVIPCVVGIPQSPQTMEQLLESSSLRRHCMSDLRLLHGLAFDPHSLR